MLKENPLYGTGIPNKSLTFNIKATCITDGPLKIICRNTVQTIFFCKEESGNSYFKRTKCNTFWYGTVPTRSF